MQYRSMFVNTVTSILSPVVSWLSWFILLIRFFDHDADPFPGSVVWFMFSVLLETLCSMGVLDGHTGWPRNDQGRVTKAISCDITRNSSGIRIRSSFRQECFLLDCTSSPTLTFWYHFPVWFICMLGIMLASSFHLAVCSVLHRLPSSVHIE